MNIEYIKEFVILTQIGNYLKASDELFISQSSLSRHIQCIETDLGAQLFTRSTRKLELTDFGELFLPYAQEITRIQMRYRDAIDKKQKNIENNIIIGYTPSNYFNVSDGFTNFLQKYPNYKLNIVEGLSDKIVDMVLNGTCNFAFTWKADLLPDELEAVPFDDDIIAAMLPGDHPLAKNKHIEQTQLLPSLDCLFLPKDPLLNAIICSNFQGSGLSLNCQGSDLTGYSSSTQVDFVSKQMGIAILNKKAALALANPSNAIVDILPEIDVTFSMIYNKLSKMNAAGVQFLHYFISRLPYNITNISNFTKHEMPLQNRPLPQENCYSEAEVFF